MRLVCPNCGAQYEVDDAVIPPNGRDVQCSNCAHGWFQPSKAMLDADADPVSPDPVPEDWDAEEWESAVDAPKASPIASPASPEATLDAAPKPEPEPEPEQDLASEPDVAQEEVAQDTPELEDALEDDEDPIDWDFDADEAEDTEGTQASAPESSAPAPTDLDADLDQDDVASSDSSDSEPAAKDDDLTDAAIAALVAASAESAAMRAAPKAGSTPRKPLDDSLLSVLREEAAREAAQRRAEGVSEMQVQDEMALDGAQEVDETPIAPAARLAAQRRAVPDFSDLNDPDAEDEDRVADLYGSEPDDPQHTRGRGRLPDIDEINDTLTATSDRAGESIAESSPEMAARRRSGFSRGFTLVIAIAAVLALAYIFAPQISARVPATEAPLARYVATVDEGRVWLNAQMSAITDKLQGDSAGAQ
ncbi:zinc-ribbon domain-containing protein [uncultured Thioclava sp.]|uniref:zinc-ribbon domain-containing protein n=1 Tax=uncultured Thioclava sp. TaxID=473858 RepID=UPI0025CFD992|nr:zinc-ribbon domain-containing protein [uncultured Thioclava sp.]